MKTEYTALKKQVYKIGEFKLVPIRYEDRFLIMEWRNEQIDHLRQSKLLTTEDQNNYFDNVVTKLFKQEKPSELLFSFLKEDVCIGYGGLVHINWLDKNAEISFLMETSLEQTSFTELWSVYLSLIEEVAFEEINLHKLFTYAFDIRPNLYPALINSGYEKEACLKQHCLFYGDFKDVIIHSKIANSTFLKKAVISDSVLTFKWANDNDVRRYSFTQNKVGLEEHSKWFKEKIESANCLYYLLYKGREVIGSIRIDKTSKNEGLINYLIDPAFQGVGYGKIVLLKMETIIKSLYPEIKKLKGTVFTENQASVKIFRKLGYQEVEENGNLVFEKEL